MPGGDYQVPTGANAVSFNLDAVQFCGSGGDDLPGD